MEASYCYLVDEAKNINEKTTNETTTNLEQTENELLSSHSSSGSTRSSTSSPEKTETNIRKTDVTMNVTTNIHDLKKNLCNEEEFRSINHSEPIHIFLKLKPLTDQEMAKQNNLVSLYFYFIVNQSI